jgi:hypothetical protein
VHYHLEVDQKEREKQQRNKEEAISELVGKLGMYGGLKTKKRNYFQDETMLIFALLQMVHVR